ncbi:MAG: OmpH family outer membrane protein [Bacteroidetes bacterium]|nr:OmpH family outer membrane protein [Bacteroidota bacterium]
MKKIVTIVAVVMGLVMAGNSVKAQAGGNKIGVISLQELIPNMIDYKKADTALGDFQNALAQQYDDLRKEYGEKDSVLSSKDTAKLTRAQLEVKRRELTELAIRIQGFQQTAQQQYQQKQQELIAPIQKKAMDAVQAVAKENGYAWVLSKEALLVSPPAEDLLPLVKKKLGVK